MNRDVAQPLVMLVDDKRENMVALEALLDDGSKKFIAVSNGEEALKVLLKQQVALVLLDVQMPGMDGIEVTELMRKNGRTRDIPVLLITAYDKSDSRILRGLQAGANDYLCKPVVGEVLQAKVENLLAHYRRHLEREHSVEESNKVKAFLHEILNTTGEGIVVQDESLRLIYANPAASYILRKNLSAPMELSLPLWAEIDATPKMHDAATPNDYTTHEAWVSLDSDTNLPLQLSCAKLRGRQGWVLAFQDIEGIKHLQHQLKKIAITDPLTGLLNRAGFFRAVNTALAKVQRNSGIVALLYLDLDQFKYVNDTYGHPVGDKLLCAFCERLQMCMRDYDVIGRIGGDEFAIMLEERINEEQLTSIAEKILQAQEQPYLVGEQTLHIGVSIGIASYPQDGTTTEQLLQSADLAMYQAKQNGRMGFRHFSHEMNARVRARTLLMDGLHQAMQQCQFKLVYQPQISVCDGTMHGVEALLRWQHPIAGLVAPSTFIPLLEESGLIVKVSNWILRKACQQRMAWHEALNADATISVNLSAKQFADETLCKQIADLLSETGLPPACLELEVTEGTIIHDIQAGMKVLRNLRDLGVRLAMDDFGTGYSSLAYLKQLPLDVLKMDRMFVANMQHDQRDRAIARAIINLAHELKMTVIAEGVETSEQFELLAEMGCELIQGYYFSKPLPPEEIRKLGQHYFINRPLP